MATPLPTPTNNPVPSTDIRDHVYAGGMLDKVVTSSDLKYTDRLGGKHLTIEGLRQVAQEAISAFGWVPVGTFQDGAELTLPNQILKDNTDGEYYRWDGVFPKNVPVGSTPSSSGGVGAGAWLSVGDSTLRTDLASTEDGKGAEMIGFNDPADGPTTVDEALKARPTAAALLSTSGNGIGYQYASDASMRDVQSRFVENLSILDYVKSDDDGDYSLALNRIFTKFTSAAAFQISFPSGTFSLKTQAVYNGQAVVSLIGQHGTTLSLESTATAANLSITSVRRIVIENMTIDVIEPAAAGAKVAIRLDCTGQDASHTIKSVRATANIITSGKGVIMWDLYNVSLGAFSDAYVRYFGDYRNSPGSNNIAWRMSATSKISTDSMYRNCSVVGCEIPWIIYPPVGGTGGAYLEGVTWIGCTVVDCQEGPYISGDSSNVYRSPMYRWIGGHISAYRRCFYAYWVSQVYISDAHFYLTYTSTSSPFGNYPVWLEQVFESDLHNLSLHMFDQTSTDSHGIHVGPGCDLTNTTSITCYTSAASYAVVSYPTSRRTRAGNCCVIYSGTAPSSAVSIANTGDLDMGNNTVYAA